MYIIPKVYARVFPVEYYSFERNGLGKYSSIEIEGMFQGFNLARTGGKG